jgi:hypothetical protein
VQSAQTFQQVLFSGALSLHSATGLNAKLCLILEIVFFVGLFLGRGQKFLRPMKAWLVYLAVRDWIVVTLGMMFLSYALLPARLR